MSALKIKFSNLEVSPGEESGHQAALKVSPREKESGLQTVDPGNVLIATSEEEP